MATTHLPLTVIEPQVLDVVSMQLGIPREKLRPSDRLIEDLNCDSLELLELLMQLEERFQITLPNDSPVPVYKAIFTRQPFRLSDLAELIYLQQGNCVPPRKQWRVRSTTTQPVTMTPFSQLDGRWSSIQRAPLLEPLGSVGAAAQYRRRSDGMRCVEIPSAEVEIGSDGKDALSDETPRHIVYLDSFLIDAEPISTTAYCRFLNSIGEVEPTILLEWFALAPDDDRRSHMLIERVGDRWQPIAGAERMPMILVSWYGANSYSLWANGRDWRNYPDDDSDGAGSCLPSEAQWEYAARGAQGRRFPSGENPPTHEQARFGQHSRSQTHDAGVLPMSPVNEQLGKSPFDLHHMSGNVWQWCQDWYDEEFYRSPEASRRNPVNRHATQVRSERGGSWVGSVELCRSSYRRGRPPLARGRCLGFRCITPSSEATHA